MNVRRWTGTTCLLLLAWFLVVGMNSPALAQGEQATPVAPQLSAQAVSMTSITAHTTTPVVHPGGGAKYTAELVATGSPGDSVYVTSLFNPDFGVNEFAVGGTTYGDSLRNTALFSSTQITFEVVVGSQGNASFRYEAPGTILSSLDPGDVVINTVCASPDPLFPDGSTICDSVTITVADDLSAQPVAFDALAGGSATIDASSVVTGGAQVDPDGNGTVDPYTYATGMAPTSGQVTWNGTSFTYSNTSGAAGADSFTVTVTDGGLNSSGQAAGQQATINVTVNVIGLLTVTNDFLTVDSGGQQTFDLSNLVTSGGKAPFQFSIQANGVKGSASINGTTLTYQADADTFGPDTVDILIEDSMSPIAQSQVGTLNVTITPPTLTVTNETLTVDSGSSASIDLAPLVTSAGIAPNSFSIYGYPSQGSANLSGSTLNYQADANTFGADSVTVTVSDSVTPTAQTATITIAISITPPPLTVHDGALIVDAGGSNSIDLATLVSSSGITPLTYIVHPGTKGTPELNGSVMTYIAGTNSFGIDVLMVEVQDSLGPDARTASFAVNVTIVPPVMRIDSSVLTFDVVEGQSITGNLSDGVFGGVTPYTFTLVAGPTQGTLDLDPSGAFTYTAHPGATGTDSFIFTVRDATEPQALSSAAELTGVATLNIIATAEPPTPTATATATPAALATKPGQTPTEIPGPTATPESGNAVPTAIATREIPPARATATATSTVAGSAGNGGVTSLPSTGAAAATGQSHNLLLLGVLASLVLLLAGGVATVKQRRW
jgi:hypothetical protein